MVQITWHQLLLLTDISVLMLEIASVGPKVQKIWHSKTRAPVTKIVFVDKCIQQCGRQGTRTYGAKNMAPVAVTEQHQCANSRNCQCWTHGLENLAFLRNTKGTEVVHILLVTNQCSRISGFITRNQQQYRHCILALSDRGVLQNRIRGTPQGQMPLLSCNGICLNHTNQDHRIHSYTDDEIK